MRCRNGIGQTLAPLLYVSKLNECHSAEPLKFHGERHGSGEGSADGRLSRNRHSRGTCGRPDRALRFIGAVRRGPRRRLQQPGLHNAQMGVHES